MPGTVLAAGEMVEPGRGCWDCQGGSGKEEPQREVGCIREESSGRQRCRDARSGLQVSQARCIGREGKETQHRKLTVR